MAAQNYLEKHHRRPALAWFTFLKYPKIQKFPKVTVMDFSDVVSRPVNSVHCAEEPETEQPLFFCHPLG